MSWDIYFFSQEWYKTYKGQVQGQLEAYSARYDEVKAICIDGGPKNNNKVTRVEHHVMQDIVDGVKSKYNSRNKGKAAQNIEVIKWTYPEFEQKAKKFLQETEKNREIIVSWMWRCW